MGFGGLVARLVEDGQAAVVADDRCGVGVHGHRPQFLHRVCPPHAGGDQGNLFWAFAYNVAAIPLAAAGPNVVGGAGAEPVWVIVMGSLVGGPPVDVNEAAVVGADGPAGAPLVRAFGTPALGAPALGAPAEGAAEGSTWDGAVLPVTAGPDCPIGPVVWAPALDAGGSAATVGSPRRAGRTRWT